MERVDYKIIAAFDPLIKISCAEALNPLEVENSRLGVWQGDSATCG